MNVIPYRDFSKSKFLPQGELKEEVWYCFVKRFTIVALPTLRQRVWLRSDDVQGRKDRRRYRRLSAICCLQRYLTRRQLLKLQSRTADEKNPWRKREIWRGKSTTSPAQRSTKTGAILFGVAHWVHIHLKLTSMCGINVVGGGGGGGGLRPVSFENSKKKTLILST